MKKIICITLILTTGMLLAFLQPANAQKKDSTHTLKNTIHFNLTNPMIFGDGSIIFGYERVLNKRRSFTINIGSTAFPSLDIIDADSIKAHSIRDNVGFHISVDYRFYLAKENKFVAPRGIYLAPYYSFNNFKNNRSWSVKSTSGGPLQEVNSELRLNIHTLGAELGYQFVFWDRLSVDMILLGPGIAAYSLRASFGTNLSEADKQKLLEKINEALAEKFPGYSRVIDDTEFKTTGVKNTTSFGYRYLVQIGFRF